MTNLHLKKSAGDGPARGGQGGEPAHLRRPADGLRQGRGAVVVP